MNATVDNNKSCYYCRICGLFQDDDLPPWGLDGRSPSFDICACCGVEFGYQDCFPEDVKAFREKWLKRGNPWRFSKEKPPEYLKEVQRLCQPFQARKR